MILRRFRIIVKSAMEKSCVGISKSKNSFWPNRKITLLADFISKTERLLNLEQEAENEQNQHLIESHSLDDLCNAGVALKKLRLLDRRIGLGARLLLKFGRNETDHPLPNHKLSPGDIVNLCSCNDFRKRLTSGVVSKVVEHSITVAIDDKKSKDDETDGDTLDLSYSSCQNRTFTIVQSVNDVTFRRLSATLKALKDYQNFPGRIMVDYFFGLRQLPTSTPGISGSESLNQEIYHEGSTTGHSDARRYFNWNLNVVQRETVDYCLNDHRPISIVHGPPGTGKTTVVVEIIRQLVKRGRKVLACAPSNVAVDNLMEKLMDHNYDNDFIRVVRLGHPARTHRNVQKYSLDLILKTKEYSDVLDDIRIEMETCRHKEKDRRLANRKLKELKRELSERENAAIRTILQNANVVCGTLTSITFDGFLGRFLNSEGDGISILNQGRRFDAAVIDECGQATELACWSALLAVSGEKCVLAGDHKQLPPTIISEEASKEGFSQSLMDRAIGELGSDIVRMLTVQYRMNTNIMKWPSENMYDGQLVAHESVATRLLRDLSNVNVTEETETPLWLIDTSDCDMPEIITIDDESKANVGEVRLVFLHIDRLIRAGVPQRCIAIVSPYNLQVQLLRTYVCGVYPDVSVRSVDGFQGQERDAVILSLVRSNDKRDVGFLADKRRMNVAITRAKRHLAVICDVRTVSSDKFLRSLVEYLRINGACKSALEYEDDYILIPFSIDLDGLTLSESAPTKTPKVKPDVERKPKVESKARGDKKPGESKKTKVSTVEFTPENIVQICDDADEEWTRELRAQLEAFISDEQSMQLSFSPTLEARQRAFLHVLAEKMGLSHNSEYNHQSRWIVVRKRATISKSQPEFAAFDDMLAEPALPEPLHSETNTASTGHVQATKEWKKKKVDKLKIAKTKSANNPKIDIHSTSQPPIGLDDEQVMETFAMEERRCKFSGCNQWTNLLNEKCRFCIQIFCLKHAMPEIHGCGEAAKRHARMTFETIWSSGDAAVTEKRSNREAEKRERLHVKLDDKLKQMQNDRKQRKPK